MRRADDRIQYLRSSNVQLAFYSRLGDLLGIVTFENLLTIQSLNPGIIAGTLPVKSAAR